jgi:hypothetical protein
MLLPEITEEVSTPKPGNVHEDEGVPEKVAGGNEACSADVT